jgi:hypothetical protein
MALTQIRGAQIQDSSILDRHVAADAAIAYSKLALSGHIEATDLNADHSVEIDVLQYKLLTLWDLVTGQAVSGTSTDVTAVVGTASATHTVTHDGTAKGVLTTGTASDGTGVENYQVQVRDTVTQEAVEDGLGGSVYAELHNPTGSTYSLYFFDSAGTAFVMGAKAQSTITCVADVSGSLAGKYFTIHTSLEQTPDYYVWYKVNGVGNNPVTGTSVLVGIEVDLATNDTANSVASKTAAALIAGSLSTAFAATANNAIITVTNQVAGFADPISDPGSTMSTGFTFNQTAIGSAASVDFMFLEVYDLLNAPLKGYITGTGFTDIVGITGSHNHNDLYYTKTELDGGQLDTRYYTQTSLQAGALDTRYYNKTDLNPLATLGNNVEDARYYTKGQINSTTSGDSGALQVGISTVSYSGGSQTMTAGTVQAALSELYNDLEHVVDGTQSINVSLDDAYEFGSTVVVDGASTGQDVVWQLGSARAFNITKADGTTVIIGATGASTPVVTIAGTVGVTGATTLTGDFLQTGTVSLTTSGTGKSFTLAGGSNAMTITAGASTITTGTLAIASTGNSSWGVTSGNFGLTTATSGNITVSAAGTLNLSGNGTSQLTTAAGALTVSTTGSGNLNLTSAGAINFTDAIATSAITFTQANAGTFVTEFAYNNPTDFNWTRPGLGTGAITSVMGAIDANRLDLAEYVGLIRTEGAALGTAGGANLIGVDGITGVIPTGGTIGGDSNLQAMLEGIAQGAGGGKYYATTSALLTAKSGGTVYFKNNELVYIGDLNRFVQVITGQSNVNVVQGTDWKYIWDGTDAISADASHNQNFNVDLSAGSGTMLLKTGTGTLTVQTASTSSTGLTLAASAGGVSVTSASAKPIAITAGGVLDLAGTGDSSLAITAGTLTVSTVTSGDIDITSAGAINETAAANYAWSATTSGTGTATVTSPTTVTLSGGDIDLTAGSGKNVSVTTIGAGTVTLTSAATIALDGGEIDLTAGTGKQVNIVGKAASKFEVDAANLTLTTATSGNINITSVGNVVETAVSSSVATTSTNVSAILLDAYTGSAGNVGGVDIEAGAFNLNRTATSGSQAYIHIPVAGSIDIQGVSNQNVTIQADGTGTLLLDSAGGQAQLSATASTATNAVLINAAAGGVEIDAATNKAVAINAPGTTSGDINLTAGYQVVVNAPTTVFNGNIVQQSVGTGGPSTFGIWTDEVYITNIGSEDFANISGTYAAGSGSANSSRLNFTIGGDPDDAMVFRSTTNGTTFTNLLTVGQSSVTVNGNLVVQGSTTTVSSTDVNIGDNATTWNAGITASTGNQDIYLQAKRIVSGGATGTIQSIAQTAGTVTLATGQGTAWSALIAANPNNVFFDLEGATNTQNNDLYRVVSVAGDVLHIDPVYNPIAADQGTVNGTVTQAMPAILRWNETAGNWQTFNLTAGNYQNIATTTGAGTTTLQTAYDGGPTIEVGRSGEADLVITLDSGKNFIVTDAGNTSLEVSQGTGSNAIAINTNGGLQVATAQGVAIDQTNGANVSSISMPTSGTMELASSSDFSAIVGGDTTLTTTGTVAISAAADDSGSLLSSKAMYIRTNAATGNSSIAIDAKTNLYLNAGGAIVETAAADSSVTVTGAKLTLTTVTSGELDVSSAGLLALSSVGKTTVTPTSGQNFEVTTAGAGKTLITGTTEVDGNFNLKSNGNFVQGPGSGTFSVSSTNTGTDSVEFTTLGGFDVDAVEFEIDGTAASTITVTGAALTISTATSGTLTVQSAAEVDLIGVTTAISASGTSGTHLTLTSADAASLTAVGFTLEAGTGAFDIEGDTASTVNVDGANLTLSTGTSGTVFVASAGALTMTSVGNASLDASGTMILNGTGNSTVEATNGNLTVTTTSSGELYLHSANGIEMKGAAGSDVSVISQTTGKIYVTAGDQLVMSAGNGFSLTGTGVASTIESNGFDLTISTIGAGDLVLQSIAGLTLQDQFLTTAIPLSQTGTAGLSSDYTSNSATSIIGALNYVMQLEQQANTFDEIYDMETGTRTIVMDNGSVEWEMSSGYAMNFAGSGGTAILEITSTGTGGHVDITGATGITGDITHSGGKVSFDTSTATAGFVVVGGSHPITLGGGSIGLNATANSNFSATSANLTLSTITSGTLAITSAGAVNITGVASSKFEITGGDATIKTITSGDIKLTSAGAITGTAAATSSILVTGADLTIGTTGSAGELYFDDFRTGPIKFSDDANTTLPTGATSILGALKKLFSEGGGETAYGYTEVTASGTDVTNGYVNVTVTMPTTPFNMGLPTSGTFPMSPSALRAGIGTPNTQYFVAVYLNGLRLAENEWQYNYTGGASQIMITGGAMVAGDIIMVDLKTLVNETY